jgi:RNA polymerase sigma-70 factor (ECF subfamily)
VEFVTFDKAYVERLREGDPSTEQHFVAYFERMLGTKLRAKGLAPHNVEDLRQETFIRVIATLRKDGGVRHPDRFGAFVNSICNNVLLEFYSSSAKNQPMQDEDMDKPDKVLNLEGLLVTKQSAEQVRRVLDRMPKRDLELLRAIFLEEKEKDTVYREDPNYTPEPPGGTLYSIAEFICTKKTMEEIASPLLADMQFEYTEAFSAGRKWEATWIRVRGCWSFFTALGINRIVGMCVRIFLRFSSR